MDVHQANKLFEQMDRLSAEVGEVRDALRVEFLSSQLAEVVDLLLTHMRELMKGQGLALEVSDAARAHIAEEGYDAEYGARPLKRAIQRLVENPLSSALLRGEFHAGDTVKVDVAGGSLVFTK